eukprot:GHVS01068917.1.p1 GENE.GHVS01068917.1~~GHVS01068917.1.p1  ORF type:complete len:572 (+),score=142.60 GHVS01068917.1:238-1716(+)
MLPIRVIGDVLLKDNTQRGRLIGHGGAIRFFLLGKQIKHSLVEVDDATWQNEKHLFAQSHGLPSPELPILSHNGIGFYGVAAVLRYLTKKLGEYGSDVRKDFVADVVTDKLASWRSSLDEAAEVLLQGLSDPSLYGYISRRTSYFDEVENMLCYFTTNSESTVQDIAASPFFTGNIPVVCDFYLFAILYDDKMLMETIESDHPPLAPEHACRLLDDRVCLRNLYAKVAALPQIAEYLAANCPVKSAEQSNSSPPNSGAVAYANGEIVGEDTPQGYGQIPNEALAEQQQPMPQPPPACFEATNMRPASSASYEPPPMLQQQQQPPPFCPASLHWPTSEMSYSYTPMPVAAAPQYAAQAFAADPRLMADPRMMGAAAKMFPQQQQQQQRLINQQQPPPAMAGHAMWAAAGQGMPGGGQQQPLRPIPHHFPQPQSQSYFPPPPVSFPCKPPPYQMAGMVPTPAVKVRTSRESPKEGSTSSEAVSYEGEELQFEMQ